MVEGFRGGGGEGSGALRGGAERGGGVYEAGEAVVEGGEHAVQKVTAGIGVLAQS